MNFLEGWYNACKQEHLHSITLHTFFFFYQTWKMCYKIMFWSVGKMKLDGRCIISCKEKILNPSLHKQFMTISYFLSVCLPLQVGPQQVGWGIKGLMFYTSVSLLLYHIQGYRFHLTKFHIYALVYCIGVSLSGLLHSV